MFQITFLDMAAFLKLFKRSSSPSKVDESSTLINQVDPDDHTGHDHDHPADGKLEFENEIDFWKCLKHFLMNPC